MTTAPVIMSAGIVVSAVVALIIASQQRKQMRQIELYKQDPTVGLVPPSSALTRFIKSNWDLVLGIASPIIGLTVEFTSDTPVTRITVLLISFNVAFLLVNLVMAIIFRVIDRITGAIGRLAGITNMSFEVIKDHFEITKVHTMALKELSGCKKEATDGT